MSYRAWPALVLLILLGACAGRGTDGALPGECPTDLLDAIGSACEPDGHTCHDPQSDPRSSLHFIMCSQGTWVEMEAAPPPPPSDEPVR